MNIQQLRIINETVRCDYSLTTVAANLYTSQSGVSKHIRDLEEELGVELFIRKGKRLLGMTEPGREMLPFVSRMLLDMQNIRNLTDQYTKKDVGRLTVAATHTQARYILPDVVVRFRAKYSGVNLILQQGTPGEIASLLLEGEADIGIATEMLGETEGLVAFPFHHWHHGVVMPHGHPLAQSSAITLADIASCPIITYHEGFTGRALIERTFEESGLSPDIILAGMDADIIKSYVELGLGIGIISSVAFNPEKDTKLFFKDCSHLFPENVSVLAVRKGHLLRSFARDFLRMCTPGISDENLEWISGPEMPEV